MKRLLMFLFLALALIAPVFGQDAPAPPTGWADVIMNPAKWFVDFGAFTVLTTFVATFFIGLLKVVKKFPRQLVAWAVAIILLVVTDLLNFGYAAEFPILLAVIHGFAAGLASNGVFDIPIMKGILTAIEGWLNPKKE